MDRAPTYEEVQAFAKSEGLDSKTNVSKFYEYYSRSHFVFKGIPIDWKDKLRKWANSERVSPTQVQPAAVRRVYWTTEELKTLLRRVDEVSRRWGK